MVLIKTNVLCKLKGHMWYCNKRKDVKIGNSIYSIAIERMCVRCGKIDEVSDEHD